MAELGNWQLQKHTEHTFLYVNYIGHDVTDEMTIQYPLDVIYQSSIHIYYDLFIAICYEYITVMFLGVLIPNVKQCQQSSNWYTM